MGNRKEAFTSILQSLVVLNFMKLKFGFSSKRKKSVFKFCRRCAWLNSPKPSSTLLPLTIRLTSLF